MQILWGECISGALYNEDFKRLAREAGFADPRVLSSSCIDVTDPQLAQITGNAVFTSITYRLFKLPDHLESLGEDYGQIATYKVIICMLLNARDSSSIHLCSANLGALQELVMPGSCGPSDVDIQECFAHGFRNDVHAVGKHQGSCAFVSVG